MDESAQLTTEKEWLSWLQKLTSRKLNGVATFRKSKARWRFPLLPCRQKRYG